MKGSRIPLVLSGSVLFMASTSMGLVPLDRAEMQACTGGDVVNEQITVYDRECHYGGAMACEGNNCAQYSIHLDSCNMQDMWLASGDDCRHVDGVDEFEEPCEELILASNPVYVRGYAPEQKWGACDEPAETNCTQTSIVCATVDAYGSAADCGDEVGFTQQMDLRKCGCDLGPWEEAPGS